jgi:hypothetical protein
MRMPHDLRLSGSGNQRRVKYLEGQLKPYQIWCMMPALILAGFSIRALVTIAYLHQS